MWFQLDKFEDSNVLFDSSQELIRKIIIKSHILMETSIQEIARNRATVIKLENRNMELESMSAKAENLINLLKPVFELKE